MSERNRKYFILIALLVFVISFSVALAAEEECIGNAGDPCPLGLAQRINNFYNWALGIGAIFALGIIVFGGILYITSAGNPDRLREARAWITAALVGLLVLFGSFLILKTLNPKLTNLEDIVLQINPKGELPELVSGTGDPEAVCKTPAECRWACELFCGGYDRPVSCDTSSIEPWPGIAQFEDTVAVSSLNIPGLSADGARVLPSLASPLRVASNIARNRGYGLYITSGWRSLTTQFELACKDLSRVPGAVAWPGSSNHGQGTAVDISLVSGTKSAPAHGSATYCLALADIMYPAGWGRYSKEFWHFEYPAPSAASQTYFDCGVY